MSLNLSNIKKISGRSGLSIKRIRRRSDMAIIWQAEQYIYQSGALLSGVSLDGFSNTGSTLYRNIEADRYDDGNPVGWYSEETGWAIISGIDMTDYSKMDINLTYDCAVGHGDAYFQYGIDSASTSVSGNSGGAVKTFTLDISSLSGTHALQFYLYARNESSEPTWGASVTLNISSIRLYN